MPGFTKLEVAALHAIISETPELEQNLAQQLEKATVTSRTNTGVGFFTSIGVPPDCPGVTCPRVLGHETYANVEGLQHGLGFVLPIRDGRLHLLEGYSADDDTASLNLGDCAFQVYRRPPGT